MELKTYTVSDFNDEESNLSWNSGMNHADLAALVTDATYSYGQGSENVPVMKGLNMSVHRGSIYGLTGSSGCGKTTLISCIIGLQKLHSGNIRLFNGFYGDSNKISNKELGYMQQEIAVYPYFTVTEMIMFFGRLYEIPSKRLKSILNHLISYLELNKNAKSLIGNLSGGQKRRLSLVIAIMHSPKLLILDEPTVGLDPLLRVKIWDYLRQQVLQHGTSVIITTHYVEELRSADQIGVMVDGDIMFQGTPKALQEIAKTTCLTDAILAIRKNPSVGQKVNERSVNQTNGTKEIVVHNGFFGSAKTWGIPSMEINMVGCLTKKNIRLTFRSLWMYTILTVAPTIALLVVLISGGEPSNLKFAVVNEEYGNTSSCHNAQSTRDLISSCSLTLLGCYFENIISSGRLQLLHYSSEQDAIKSVQEGHSYGYVYFSENFTTSIIDRALNGPINESNDEAILNASRVKVRVDQTNSLIYYFIQLEFYQAQEVFMATLFEACLGNANRGTYPFRFNSPIFGNANKFEYAEQAGPGASIVMILLAGIASSGIRLLDEINSGMFQRLGVTGIGIPDMLISHFLTELAVTFFQTLQLIGVVLWWTPPLKYELFPICYIFYLYICAGLTGAVIGYFLALLLKNLTALTTIAIVIFFALLILSGVNWPLEAMPPSLQQLVPFLPCTLPVDSLRWVWNRGLDISHPKVWSGTWIFPIYIVGFLLLISITHKIKTI